MRVVMDMETSMPKRKHPRLKEYDYSTNGAYFITVCTQDRRCLLSRIVGRGLAPAEIEYTKYGKIAEEQLLLLEYRYPFLKVEKYVIMPNHIHVIFMLDDAAAGASPRPTEMERYRAEQSENNICRTGHELPLGATRAVGASPRPTIPEIVCAYKSLTTRACKRAGFVTKLFQTSFYDHVIRGQADYDEIFRYIEENPLRWELDKLYSEE